MILTLGLAACQVQPPRGDEPKSVEPAARQQTEREAQQKREAQQRQQAARAAEQRKEAERQRQEAERAAQQERCLASVRELKDIADRWQALERQASTSPRIKLPIPLGNMRKTRKELEALPEVPCSAGAKADLAKATGLTETHFVNFLGNNRKYLNDQKARAAEGRADRQMAKQLLDKAAAELARIEACKGPCQGK